MPDRSKCHAPEFKRKAVQPCRSKGTSYAAVARELGCDPGSLSDWVRAADGSGCVHHSDHGAQYVSVLPSKTTRENGIRPSMGAARSPWDNAAMESLMGTVESEGVHARVYDGRERAELDPFERIECVYNRVRIHSALGYVGPTDFEKANWPEEEKSRPMAE